MEEKKSWLACNIAYIQALAITFVWVFLSVVICLRLLNVISMSNSLATDLTVLMAFWATIVDKFGTIINFYFGSASTSKTKDETIKNLSKTEEV